ncbi:MAG: DUF3541 domain-containing protein [Bacteroidota bacterium]
MKIKIQFKKSITVAFVFVWFVSISFGQRAPIDHRQEYQNSAQKILRKYEHHVYKLKPSKAGHMGLRLWRNYKDDEYKYLLLQGINHTSQALDKIVNNGLDKRSIYLYVKEKNAKYKASTKKKKLRKETFTTFPKYRFMATKVLRHVARLDELGLRHKNHQDFMKLLHSYNFEKAFTNPQMIKAWGAQLANQVYWLHHLGVADYRVKFAKAVARTYPDEEDGLLNKQQFQNKIYTLTHIIIAASGYYRHQVDYQEHKEIIDYFRANTDLIIERCKEDIIIEVGLSLLLVDESIPEIETIRAYINSKVDPKKKMVLSENGKSSISQGEHRNIIAVLLLDWQGCSPIPTSVDIQPMEGLLSESLVFK